MDIMCYVRNLSHWVKLLTVINEVVVVVLAGMKYLFIVFQS